MKYLKIFFNIHTQNFLFKRMLNLEFSPITTTRLAGIRICITCSRNLWVNNFCPASSPN